MNVSTQMNSTDDLHPLAMDNSPFIDIYRSFSTPHGHWRFPIQSCWITGRSSFCHEIFRVFHSLSASDVVLNWAFRLQFEWSLLKKALLYAALMTMLRLAALLLTLGQAGETCAWYGGGQKKKDPVELLVYPRYPRLSVSYCWLVHILIDLKSCLQLGYPKIRFIIFSR